MKTGRRLLLFLLPLLGFFAVRHPVRRPASQVLPPGLDVQRYHAVLSVMPDSLYLEGEVTIILRDTGDADRFPLFLRGLRVDSMAVDSVAVDVERSGDTLWVPLAQRDSLQEVFLRYHGRVETGLYRQVYGGKEVLFTDSWPERARGWLPSFDHPVDPAAFELELDLPERYEPIATGRLMNLERRDGRVYARYRLNGTAPTYAMAFAAADFSHYAFSIGDTLPVHFYLLPPDSARMNLLERTAETLLIFSYLIGPYPYEQYGVAQIPIGYGGMENASLPFLKAEMFATTSPGAGNQVESVQVHEAAHQWFGDAVTIADWNHLWLSEGMATYLTTVFYEQIDGPEEALWRRAEMAVFGNRERRSHGPLVPAEPVEPEQFLNWVPYRKGGCVLHLLRLRLGDDVFFDVLRTAYARYRGRAWSTEDFRQLLEQRADTTLESLFAYWVYGDRVPVLHLHWDGTTRRLDWRVKKDEGTLAGIPFQLLVVSEDERVEVLPVADSSAVFPDWPATRPSVLPVGILLDKQWD